MTVYYIDSVNGSDKNSGADANSAFASLAKVEALKLKAGDTVLLANGSVFHEQFDIKWSGKDGAPITISNYGKGELPVISGGEVGIYGSKASNIVIENVKITDTGTNAIYAGNASNWTVRNVTVTETGSADRAGSVSFQSSKNIKIENCTISDTFGDGIWVRNSSGVQILNNKVTNAQGHNADAIQINDSSHIVIKGNFLQQSDTDSSKGVLCVIRPEDALIENNTMIGGGFGIAAHAGNGVQIHNNDISGFGGYSWSYGIGLGDSGNNKNYDISGNYIHDGVNGVLISCVGQPNYVRENINIHNNVFDHLSKTALQISREVSGSFKDNIIGDNVSGVKVSAYVANVSGFHVGTNKTISEFQAELQAETAAKNAAAAAQHETVVHTFVAKQDIVHVDAASNKALSGNILANDDTDTGTLMLRKVGNATMNKSGLDLTGKYGTLHVDADGHYSYKLDYSKIAAVDSLVSDSFSYKISNGVAYDSDSLIFKIDAHMVNASHDLLH